MGADIESILFSSERIAERVAQLAHSLDAAFQGKYPLAVGILKGSFMFFADLVRAMSLPVQTDFMCVSTYGSGTTSQCRLTIKKDTDASVAGRDVIIVEDIIDSGFTLENVRRIFLERGARSVTIVTLLDKPARRTAPLQPDYRGFVIGDEFVVGYGLDYAEKYRSLPYIGVLSRSVYEK